MNNNKTKLSLDYDGTIMSIEFDNIDVDLDQFFQAFKALMVGATFSEKQFDYWIIDKAELLIDTSNINQGFAT